MSKPIVITAKVALTDLIAAGGRVVIEVEAPAGSTPESSVEVASTAFDWRCKPPEIPSVDRVISYLRDYGPGTPDTTDCYMMRWAADHLANLESRANHWQRVAETPAESKP